MRLIDADEITATLEIAISMMENTKSIIGVENLPVIDVEIKAYTDILKGIKEQPTVQPEPQWIPCSERMPEDGRYICDYGDCIDFGRVTHGNWYVDGVVAWMPLPVPYQRGGEEDVRKPD